MKKLLLLAAVAGAFAFTSCKKDRVCECVPSDTAPAYNGTTDQTTYIKVTKGQAKANCVSTKSDYKFGNNTYTHTETCTLK